MSTITHVLIPTLGAITSSFLGISGIPRTLQASRKGALEGLSPVPTAVLCGNSMVWMIYAVFLGDHILFIANVSNLLITSWTLLVLYGVSDKATKKSVERLWVSILFLIVMMWYAGAVLIPDVARTAIADYDAARVIDTIYGAVGNAFVIVFYGTPLSALYRTFKARDSSTIVPAIAAATLINSIFWGSYGVALGNLWIWLPNTLGISTSFTQLLFVCIFPRKFGGVPAVAIPPNSLESLPPGAVPSVAPECAYVAIATCAAVAEAHEAEAEVKPLAELLAEANFQDEEQFPLSSDQEQQSEALLPLATEQNVALLIQAEQPLLAN